MEKLNICLISLTFAPDSQDGAAKFFTGVYNYMKNQGHNVKVITGKWNFEFSDPDIFQVKLIRKRFFWFPQFIFHLFFIFFHKCGITFFRYRNKRLFLLSNIFHILRNLNKHKNYQNSNNN